MSSTCFELESSSSGRRRYIQLRYGTVRTAVYTPMEWHGTVRHGTYCCMCSYGMARYGTARTDVYTAMVWHGKVRHDTYCCIYNYGTGRHGTTRTAVYTIMVRYVPFHKCINHFYISPRER
jgi:hypothetical protein